VKTFWVLVCLWCIVSGDGESGGMEAAKVGQERRGSITPQFSLPRVVGLRCGER